MSKLIIKHDLDKLTPAELTQYLRDVSEYIGLDPDLNGLDTIWMDNEAGQPGRSLVVYARRGTAEILRNVYKVDVLTLTYNMVSGSIVYTATGKSNTRERTEVAIGSKWVQTLTGKALDDAIMTASTRALRRLTMQFTTLGILDESEVVAIVGQVPNPAGSALPSSTSTLLPAVFLPPSVPANNAPGKPVEAKEEPKAAVPPPATVGEPFLGQKAQIDAAWQQVAEKEAEKAEEVAPKPKKTRKKANTVVLDVEPEVVSTQANPAAPQRVNPDVLQAIVDVAVQASQNARLSPEEMETAAKELAKSLPAMKAPIAFASFPLEGLPSKEQMDEYRKKISVYTVELPASENLGSTQKMRAFITKNTGTPPQDMTVAQWEEIVSWFDTFTATNGVKGLVKYINDTLGVK